MFRSKKAEKIEQNIEQGSCSTFRSKKVRKIEPNIEQGGFCAQIQRSFGSVGTLSPACFGGFDGCFRELWRIYE